MAEEEPDQSAGHQLLTPEYHRDAVKVARLRWREEAAAGNPAMPGSRIVFDEYYQNLFLLDLRLDSIRTMYSEVEAIEILTGAGKEMWLLSLRELQFECERERSTAWEQYKAALFGAATATKIALEVFKKSAPEPKVQEQGKEENKSGVRSFLRKMKSHAHF